MISVNIHEYLPLGPVNKTNSTLDVLHVDGVFEDEIGQYTESYLRFKRPMWQHGENVKMYQKSGFIFAQITKRLLQKRL